MKLAYASLVIAAFAAASLQSLAASQSDTTQATATSTLDRAAQPTQVRTSDTGWAVPQSVALDPQTVQSHGGSLRPGPHNRQISPAHGGPVVSAARPDQIPGRE